MNNYLLEFKCSDMPRYEDKEFNSLTEAVKFISDIHGSTILEYWLLYKIDSDTNYLIGDNVSGLYLVNGDKNND